MTSQTVTGVVEPKLSPGSLPSGLDAAALWACATQDAGRPVLVTNSDGRVVFANDPYLTEFSPGDRDLVGRGLPDVMGTGVAGERLSLIRRAMQQARPVMLLERVHGRWSRTVIRAVREVSGTAGREYVFFTYRMGEPPEGAEALAGSYDVVRAGSDDPGLLAKLSPREIEVLALVGAGMSTRAIAKHLCRTLKTVEWHRASLGRKLGMKNRVQLAQVAIAAGLVDHPESKALRPEQGPAEGK